MFWILLSLPAHHSEPGDPELLESIQHRIDALVGLEPAVIVVLLGLLIVSMPVAIVAFFEAHFFRIAN